MLLATRPPERSLAHPEPVTSSYLILSAVVVYFGYFFINFFSNEVFDTDLSFW